MISADWLSARTSWRRAFLLSALLHALALGGLALLPGPRVESAAADIGPFLTASEIVEEGDGGETFLFPRLGDTPKSNAGQKAVPLTPGDKPPIDPILIGYAPQPNPSEGNPASPGGKPAPGMAAGNPAGGPGQNPGNGATGAKPSFFQVPTQGRKIVYVIDRSSSMGKQGALETARRELIASLQSLPDDAFFQIIVYNSTAQPLIPSHPDWFPASASNTQWAAQELARLDATGGTVHHFALPLALSLRPDVVFFLTDADDLQSSYLADITRHNQGQAVIHVIELNTSNLDRPDAPLQTFAHQNHGVYRAVDLNR